MQQKWPGSRWWKVDFHTHTPASNDYKGDTTIQPEDWLEQYLKAGINCVVITDHNSGAWIDKLQASLKTLKENKLDKWSDFEIFPGVEISCNGGVHILAILDPSKNSADIEALIGAVGYSGSRGDSDAVTNESISNVIDKIHQADGIACSAHIDKPKGLLTSITDYNTLQPILKKLDALEIIDLETEAIEPHKERIEYLAAVLGSDSHSPEGVGRGFTWVKMSNPTIEGLRLALLDPKSAIHRGDQQYNTPQLLPELWIESITLKDMHLVRVNPLMLSFSPSYNALIGGRGSGKSSVIEGLRLSLARDNELHTLLGNPDIEKTFTDFKKTNTSHSKVGMMLANSEISIIVNKGVDAFQEQYQYVWKNDHSGDAGLEIYRREDDEWKLTNLNNEQAREVFPIKIFSQKQILALANNPQALLEYIDNSITEEKLKWQNDFDIKKQKLLDERAELQKQKLELQKKPAVENEYKEARNKARVFSNDTFGDLLKAYKQATAQKSKLDNFYEGIENNIQILQDAINEIDAFDDVTLDKFEDETDAEKAMKAEAKSVAKSLAGKYGQLVKDVVEMSSELDEAKLKIEGSDWNTQNNQHIAAYKNETTRLKEAGIESAEAAAEAVATEARLSVQLTSLRKIEQQLLSSEAAVRMAEEELTSCREKLTAIRQNFIADLFKSNDTLKVTLQSMADSRGAGQEHFKFLELIQ